MPDGGGGRRGQGSGEALPTSPACPFCESRETHLVSPFGGQMSVAQYWCRACRTAFEYLKWGTPAPGE